MKYFIHSVQTYATTGKTRKGAMLQSVAVKFEGAVIDTEALREMTVLFRTLVDITNRRGRGKPLAVHTSAGSLCVKPQYNGNDNHIFTISFKPIRCTLDTDAVREIFPGIYGRTLPGTTPATQEGGAQ